MNSNIRKCCFFFMLSIAAVVLASRAAPGQTIEAAPDFRRLTPVADGSSAIDVGPGGLPSSVSLPATFDLRNVGGVNYVSPVGNQGSCGSCWTFATMGALESSILMQSGGTILRDFSENHLKNYHGGDWGPCDGGNEALSQAYFSRGSGPINESDDPYHAWDDRPSPGGPVQGYVRTSLYLDTTAEMKTEMMARGALYTHMYYTAGSYRSSDQTYYYNGAEGINHAVTIVGWDDAKATAAPSPGAWLVKNSWGTGWGNAGYFWMSYSDTKGGKFGATFEDFQAADSPGAFTGVYYHDEFGYVTAVNTPYAMNAFTASAAGQLAAVQFWTTEDGASYEMRIYGDFVGGSLTNLLASASGTLQYEGYCTIDLSELIPVAPGDDFYVYLYLVNPSYGYPQAIDAAYSNYNSRSTANPGESYYSFNGTSWTDINGWNNTANFAIKVLTVPEPGCVVLLLVGGFGWLYVGLRRRRGR